ncbi:tail fiber assembly protein [Flavobacterium sp. ABG]|uniref:tail fiber assembly protein n=1 Tax=Flavobacterium sp. ABG TaxID=1423322 RepID=UPI0009E40739|nr:tail fiber assembly protein [Flavobacterium sp. ABG]
MYKGTYNKKGEYTGFYVEGVHENIPKPNIELTKEEWQQALSKDYKVVDGVHTYSAFIKSNDAILENVKLTRNTLLTDSDWSQVPDSPLSEEKKAEWQKYRQELRDLTTLDNLATVIWPTKPL